MAYRFLASSRRLPAALTALSMVMVPACGGERAPATGTSFRTADGHPDLRGVWNFSSVTPLERPADVTDKAVVSDAEAPEFQRRLLERRNSDRRSADPVADLTPAYNEFWKDNGTTLRTNRTSLIVDPPDGRLPPLTEEGKRLAGVAAERAGLPGGPEDEPLPLRCLIGLNSGPPMFPIDYNNNVALFQTRDHLVILNEMVHNARIVPLDGRPHDSIRQWVGDSRGRWEGDTLVIDTIHFKGSRNFRGGSADMHLVERFRRESADGLTYTFTIEDPTVWTRPWTVELPMAKTTAPIYEYACHEGNMAMANTLAGARFEEKLLTAAVKKP